MPYLTSVENIASILVNHEKQPASLPTLHRLYDGLQNHGLTLHRLLRNHLDLMLAKPHTFCDRHSIEKESCNSDASSISDLIHYLIKQREPRHALFLYLNVQKIPLHVHIHTLVALIKVCASFKRFHEGCEIHAEIARKGIIKRDLYACNTLIYMYMKWGWLAHAQGVFDRLSHRDVVSWTVLMSGYVNNEYGETGLKCLEQMQSLGVSPNALTHVLSLKACGVTGAAGKGREIHAEIERRGLLNNDCILGNAVVDMYVKLGWLAFAQEAFDILQVRDVISWTALITGYSKYECGIEALRCFDQMQAEGVSPNAHTYASSLKACAVESSLVKGKKIHMELKEQGLLGNPVIGSALVEMYINCGLLSKAEDVHIKFENRDIDSWNSLITGYLKHGRSQEALDCFENLQFDGVDPNSVTYAAILKACGSVKDLARGIEVHEEVSKDAVLKRDFEIGIALVDMYARCGLPAKAWEVFNMLSVQDVRGWNALIAGYTVNGCSEEALKSFERMQTNFVTADASTFIFVLNACGMMKAFGNLLEVHAEIARQGVLNGEVLVGNTLVDTYTKCGRLARAEEVVKGLMVRDVVSWTTLIAGYANEERGIKALECFEQMQFEGICPNVVTYACALKACASIYALNKGEEIYEEVGKLGMSESSVELGSAVVDMYAKCGLLKKAQDAFDRLQKRDVVAWNALISGYAGNELGKEALQIYERMRKEGVSPNSVTYVSTLKACGTIQDVKKGQAVHADIDGEGVLLNDLSVGNALVDMYAKCKSLAKAQDVFEQLPSRDVIAWNGLIAGYVNQGKSKVALKLYEKMQVEGIAPDALTFFSCLKACGNLGAVGKGKELHVQIARNETLRGDLIVCNALVEFYVKCSLLRESQELFDDLPVRDVATWNILMSGYARSGIDDQVFFLYEKMSEDGGRPDHATFLSILNTCGHAGLVDKAECFWEIMTVDYSLSPSLEHYTCIIDLLGRSGHLSRAIKLIERMHSAPDIVVWNVVLEACQKWGSVELARQAFAHAISLDASDSLAYLCMCKICVNAGMLEDANRVEAMRVENSAM